MTMQARENNLLIITRFPWQTGIGGEERVFLQLADGVRAMGGTVVFVASDVELLSAAQQFAQRRVWGATDITTRLTAIFAPLLALALLPQLAWQLWRLGRGQRQKAVIMLTLIEKIFATPLACWLGYRVIWAHHAQVRGWLTRNPWRWLWRRHLRRGAAVIVVPSKLVADDLRAAASEVGEIIVGVRDEARK